MIYVFGLSHTISGHAHRQTFLETALLAAISVHPHDRAALILEALFVLDVLLYASSEKTLGTHNNPLTKRYMYPCAIYCIESQKFLVKKDLMDYYIVRNYIFTRTNSKLH